MDFKDSCEAIKAAFMLTDKEKSKLISKVRDGDSGLIPILQEWKNSEFKNGEGFYDTLKANKYIGQSTATTPNATNNNTPHNMTPNRTLQPGYT